MQEVFSAANRNNAAIYALDPRGLAVNEFDIDEPVGPTQDRIALGATTDTLRTLSQETDGRAIVGRNDLARGLEQVVRDSSVYYLIGYSSSQTPTDGKFHEIKVRVKRPGVNVRARRGYWAATAADVTRATAPARVVPKAVESALAALAPPIQAGRYVQTWIGSQRGPDGKTRLTLVWEPVRDSAGARREQAGRVSVIAATADGDLVFRGRAPDVALASTAPAPSVGATSGGSIAGAQPSSGPQRLVFDAPPGRLELRLSIEAAGAGGTLDNEIRTLTVPDLTAPDAALSTPRVFRARTARDFQALAGNGDAVPTAAREFSRTDRLLIRFDSYGASPDTPKPSAALLNRSGQKMSDLPIVTATAGGTHQIDLGLASVPSGEYLVEITVPGAAPEIKELIPIRIVS